MKFPAFDSPVPDNGYRWWYLDAVSNDEKHALTVIAFVGSVFSPYYASAKTRQAGHAQDFCALNVALYGPKGRWSMTERNHLSLEQRASSLMIGRSRLTLDQARLTYDIDEWACPIPRRVRGQLIVDMNPIACQPVQLDDRKEHWWQLLSPQTRIQVNLEQPDWCWEGNAYVDGNWGNVPLENSFRSWQWSRAHLSDASTLIQYDTLPRVGEAQSKTFHVDQRGQLNDSPWHSEPLELPRTRYWRMARQTRREPSTPVCDLVTLEDSPFYSRSRYNTLVRGLQATCIHESLDLDRFQKHWVRTLLPFRMPRNTRAVRLETPAAPAD